MRFVVALLLRRSSPFPRPSRAGPTISTVAVQNTMQPGVVRIASGVELAAYSDGSGTLEVWSSTTGDHTVASGLLSVGKPALVQLPSGAVELYAPATTSGFAEQGVLRCESTSDGASWSAPVPTGSTSLADVQAAAVRPDGTPMFTQDGTFGVVVYQGLNGEVSHTVFGACCGYAESLAVDTSNYAQIAFWSNAAAFPSQFVYEGLDATGVASRSRPRVRPAADRAARRRRSAGRRRARQHLHGLVGWLPVLDELRRERVPRRQPPLLDGGRRRHVLRWGSAHGARSRPVQPCLGRLDAGRRGARAAVAQHRAPLRRGRPSPRSAASRRTSSRRSPCRTAASPSTSTPALRSSARCFCRA